MNLADRGQATLFHRLYTRAAGRHPDLRPWHFQWLAGVPLYRVLRPLLSQMRGSVLDVGCGYKPYRDWVPGATRYFGIDIFLGPEVDAVLTPGEPWPVADGEFDVILCTQVLEHVADVELTVSELARATRPGGEALITVPFIFGEHNSPNDYRRFSRHGITSLLKDRFEILGTYPHGAIGSTLGAILLGWSFDAMPTSTAGRLMVAPLLPLWLGFCLLVNLSGWTLDRFDRTGLYYGNVLCHVRRNA